MRRKRPIALARETPPGAPGNFPHPPKVSVAWFPSHWEVIKIKHYKEMRIECVSLKWLEQIKYTSSVGRSRNRQKKKTRVQAGTKISSRPGNVQFGSFGGLINDYFKYLFMDKTSDYSGLLIKLPDMYLSLSLLQTTLPCLMGKPERSCMGYSTYQMRCKELAAL